MRRIAVTACSTTPAATPRQPQCTIATAPGAASATGTQSATSTSGVTSAESVT
jgi:hypothetical protein